MNNIAFDVLILATLLLVLYFKNKQLISFLNSNLGRFVLIVIVIILSVRNVLYGVLALVLFFILRENYYVEGLDSSSYSSSEVQGPSLVNVNEVPLDGSITVKSVQESVTTETVTKTTSGEGHDIMISPNVSSWRENNCSNDNLPLFNGKIVAQSDVTNVFPNVSFIDKPCNPCDSECKILVSSSSDNISPSTIMQPVSSNMIPSSQTRGGNAFQSLYFYPTDGTKAGSGLNVTPFPIPSQNSPSNLVNKTAPNATKISPAMAPPIQSIASMPK